MRNITVVIIVIFTIIFLWTIKNIRNIVYNRKEHLSNQSDEAIQNLASLYNKDELTIGKMNVTGEITGPMIDGLKKNLADLGKRITDTDAKLTAAINVQKGRVDYIDANTAYRGRKYKIKNYGKGAGFVTGGYGPYLYSGNHDQVLWRNKAYIGQPWYDANRFEFSIE